VCVCACFNMMVNSHVFDWAKIQNLEKKFGHKNTSGYNSSFIWYDGGETPFVAKFFPFLFKQVRHTEVYVVYIWPCAR